MTQSLTAESKAERESRARRATSQLMQRQPHVSCTGWRFHCICSRHQTQADGLLDRHRQAIVNEDEHLQLLLKQEITNQQVTLGRKR